ncbi:uncharacterized protein OCT59_002649 [Rhizophagus irregularis]|nr:hypothetical protein RhiirB3_441124 [Rhizophagus irregularis]UZO11075.1 hypothetical protein OCT59_002649 [Rhizophagus irregularis]
MGNNKNKSKSKTLSSYIPIQEFVDNFTTSGCGSCTWNVQVARLFRVQEETLLTLIHNYADTYPTGPLSSMVMYGIILRARFKAYQQLNSLSSRYQNALPKWSKAYMSKDTNINLLIDESMNADGDEDLNFTTSQSNQKGDLNDQQISLSISKPIGTSIPAE